MGRALPTVTEQLDLARATLAQIRFEREHRVLDIVRAQAALDQLDVDEQAVREHVDQLLEQLPRQRHPS